MRVLEQITIKNFKSIREQKLALGPLNVFIGGNGAGKSNLIEVFRFLREIVNQNLAGYVALKGGADALLYFGRRCAADAGGKRARLNSSRSTAEFSSKTSRPGVRSPTPAKRPRFDRAVLYPPTV